MSKQIEALKMAIEALKNAKDGIWSSDSDIAIQTCKEALAEAEQKEKQEKAFAELVKLNQEMGGYDIDKKEMMINGLTEQETNETLSVKGLCKQNIQEQESVAWMYQVNQIYTQFSDIEPSYDEYDEWSLTPLYTHPATWQSLSDDNILKLFKPKFECEIEDFELIDFARAIEQALKELNAKK